MFWFYNCNIYYSCSQVVVLCDKQSNFVHTPPYFSYPQICLRCMDTLDVGGLKKLLNFKPLGLSINKLPYTEIKYLPLAKYFKRIKAESGASKAISQCSKIHTRCLPNPARHPRIIRR